MASKLTFGTGIADWQERINVDRMRTERADKARKVLRKHGVAAIVAARNENRRYLSGLRGPDFLTDLWYVLFFAEGDQVVFHHAGWLPTYPAEAPWIKHWRLARNWVNGGCGPEAMEEEAKLFADGIYRELAERKLTKEKLAVVGFDGTATRALIARGLNVVEGWPLMLEATKTKTVDEISCLKMAYAISDNAWNKTWELAKPGTSDIWVVQQAMLAAFEAGADITPRGNVHSGPTSYERGFNHTGRILQHGDLFYAAYCGIGYMGYNTCYYRTFSVGAKPERKVLGWYKELIDRMNAIIDTIKPGATTADAAKHFPPASKWGYQDEAEVLSMEIGHGIGMYHYGYPIINRQWSLKHPQVFEEGMTFAIEGREGEPGVGVRIEDAVVVTKNGAELIDHWPRDEILVAPRI